MGTGHDQRTLAGGGEDPSDVKHVLGLQSEVELLDDGVAEDLDQRRRVGQGGHRDATDQQRGDPAHGGQILAYRRRHAGSLHLDDDPLTGVQYRSVNLGDGGRGEWLRIEGLEHLVEWSAQVGFDDPPDQFEGFGRDPVAQEAELVNKLLGEEALT